MRRPLLLLALLLQACDKPAASPPPAATPAPLPQGKLRLERSATPVRDLLKEATPGFPSLVVKMTYGGLKTYLDLHLEAWHQGQRIGNEKGHQSFKLPLNDEAAFGFSDVKDKEGKDIVRIHQTFPVESKTVGSGNSSRVGGTSEFGMPALKKRSTRTLEPAWPLEIADGTDALIWAVFVDEPADVPAGATPEERAKRAGSAWLFRIRTADEKK
jgi:hypothetical protein